MFIYLILTLILMYIAYYFVNMYFTGTKLNDSQKEGFNGNKKVTILVFLSSSCPHCTTYKNKTHPVLEKFAKSKGYELKLVPENDSDTFSKYDIQFIPSCIILSGDKKKQVKGEISVSNIQKTINDM
jgi:thiol-disulfide isomerase/thioredoxin